VQPVVPTPVAVAETAPKDPPTGDNV
jgi:hypothetical protein